MTKKINKPEQTPESEKNTKLQNSEMLEALSTVEMDTTILQDILENDKYKVFQEIKTLEDIDSKVSEAFDDMDTTVISDAVSLLEKYQKLQQDREINWYIESFLEENHITDMDEKFLELPEHIRIVIAIYRSQIKKYSYSCGWGFGYYKTPTGCGGCIQWKENMEKADLNHLMQYIGDRQYQVSDKKIKEAKSKFLLQVKKEENKTPEIIEKTIDIYQKKLKTCTSKLEELRAIGNIVNNAEDRKKLLSTMPWFIDHVRSTNWASRIQVDFENKVAAYLEWTTRRWGSSGCEYGNYVAVWYDGKRQDRHVVYRDAYDAAKDNRSLSFDKVEIEEVKVEWDQLLVTVKASSNSNFRIYTFNFPLAKEEKSWLTAEEQEKFIETFEKSKKELLLAQNKRYENRTMPSYCLPSDMTYNGMQSWDVAYAQPRIETEYMDKSQWIWAVVIVKQIDHGAGHKRQLAWEGWLIKQDGTYDRVEYETMRDIERLNGKQIKMIARDIVQKNIK